MSPCIAGQLRLGLSASLSGTCVFVALVLFGKPETLGLEHYVASNHLLARAQPPCSRAASNG
eukprot:6470931-Prymnesium_polylepis.2